jgi:hypothetical protein
MPLSPPACAGRRFTVAIFACASLGACSTLVKGTDQQVAIATPGAARASCQLTGGDGVSLVVTTPGTVRLPKSKKDINVACSAPGEQPASRVLQSSYSDWSYIQHPLGYAVDGISGGMWAYPETFDVPFGNGGQTNGRQPQTPADVAPVSRASS